jgi:hypothetical protein
MASKSFSRTINNLVRLTAFCFALTATKGICLGQLIDSFVQGTTTPAAVAGNYGYSFTVGPEPITVTQLGLWDGPNGGAGGSGDGLLFSHQVGLWDASSQTLITSATVEAGSAESLFGEFRYHGVAPVELQAGHSYVLSVFYSDNGDVVAASSTATAGTDVTKGNAQTSATVDRFAFPEDVTSFANDGWYGPNAVYTVVPEPEGWTAIGALALLGFALCMRVCRAFRLNL